MDLLRALHRFDFMNVPSPWVILLPDPFTVCCFLLMLWSFGVAFRGQFSHAFRVAVRGLWVLFGVYGVSGVLLSLSGLKVASAVALAGKNVTRYGFPPQAKRDPEHWMYAAFVLLSLFVIEALMAQKLLDEKKSARVLPVVTLFMWGAAVMIVHVAVVPAPGG